MTVQVMFGVLLLEQMVLGIWVPWWGGESQIARGLACQAEKYGLDPVKQLISVKGLEQGEVAVEALLQKSLGGGGVETPPVWGQMSSGALCCEALEVGQVRDDV